MGIFLINFILEYVVVSHLKANLLPLHSTKISLSKRWQGLDQLLPAPLGLIGRLFVLVDDVSVDALATF